MNGEPLLLEMTLQDAAEFTVLADASEKTLEEVKDSFRTMLAEASEHPFRDTLPETVRSILTHLETLPNIDLDRVPAEAATIVKGWLLHNAMTLAFVVGYYEAMSEAA